MSDQCDYTEFLHRKTVFKLKWIINIARRISPDKVKTAWPDQGELPAPWQDEWTALKHVVMSSSSLTIGGRTGGSGGHGHLTVDLRELWACDNFQRLLGEKVREVPQMWARANNLTLPDIPSPSVGGVTRAAPAMDAAKDAETVSAQQGGVTDDALHQWTVSHLNDHKDDAKHPSERQIVQAAKDHFKPATITKLRDKIREIPKPPEWNRRGRKPRRQHSA
jgi:hypothetical protein